MFKNYEIDRAPLLTHSYASAWHVVAATATMDAKSSFYFQNRVCLSD